MSLSSDSKLERRMLYSHARASDAGSTVLDYLASHYSRWDRDGWKRQFELKRVERNGLTAAADDILREHDKIAYFPGDLPEPDADLSFSVVYEDADLIVFNKSGDLCVHPAGPFFKNTLWHAAGLKYGELRFVHRLDRETSGLLIAARNPRTAARMTNGKTPVHKEYLALVFGRFSGQIDAKGYLEHDPLSAVPKKQRFVLSDGPRVPAHALPAETLLKFEEERSSGMTLVRAVPVTGRQHQIRATLYSLGFPLAGDKLYGPDERIFLKIKTQTIAEEDRILLRMPRQALHSAVLEFPHPSTGRLIRCEAPLPPDFPS